MTPGNDTAIALRELIAGNLRRLREAAGRELDDLVPTARAHGLDWTVTWLASVERGTRALSAEHLLALPVVLSAALGTRVSLADLLVGEAAVVLGSTGRSVPGAYLLEVVTGPPVRRTFTPTPRPPESAAAAAAARAVQRLRDIRDAGLGDVDIRALTKAESEAGAADARLAKRLGVPPIAVVAAAASLWGSSVSVAQAALTAAGMSAAAAGRQVSAAIETRLRQARIAALEARLAAESARPPDDTDPLDAPQAPWTA